MRKKEGVKGKREKERVGFKHTVKWKEKGIKYKGMLCTLYMTLLE